MVQLIELLAEKNLVRLLSFFLQNPTAEMSQVQIAKKLKLAKGTLIKWIKHLEKLDIISLKKVGATNLCSLRREKSIVKQLKVLYNLSLLASLKKILSRNGIDIKIYLYGSAARGEDIESSDFDVMIIGRLQKEDIINEVNKLAEGINKDIGLEIFSDLEWSEMSRKDKAFYERVEKDKVEL